MNKKEIIYSGNFDCLDDFLLEGDGKCYVKDGKIFLDDTNTQNGMTLWLKRQFKGDLHICYDAMVVKPLMASNLNLFFMARTLQDEPIWSEQHSGDYHEYHEKTKMYIMTMIGKYPGKEDVYPGWTRIRKNPGFILFSERFDKIVELEKNYSFEIIKRKNEIECKVNGELIHKIVDNESYIEGAIGFRTWRTHLWLNNLKIYSI